MTGKAKFRAAHASGASWQDAAGQIVARLGKLGRAHRLGFVYVTEAYAEALAEIEIFLRQTTGVPHWIGAAGMGVCGTRTEYFDTPAMSVMVMPVDDNAFRVFRDVKRSAGAVVRANREWLASADPPLAIVHADPRNQHVQGLVSKLSEAANAYLVGGLTTVAVRPGQLADGVAEDGLSGVFLSPHAMPVAVGLTQGCTPIGPTHTVTRAQGNILVELDERPALEIFSGDVGDPLSHDPTQLGGYIFAALAGSGGDAGDYMVRNLMGFDRDNGLLAIGDVVSPGDRVLFCRRDANTAADDLRRMLGRLRQRAAGGIKGGLYYSCVARGPNQFGDDSDELKIIADELGDFPLAGLFANGEINHNRLYGYTGVLTLFL